MCPAHARNYYHIMRVSNGEVDMTNKNPHCICTWDDDANCSGCGIQGKLACKWDQKILHGFHGIAWPPLIMIIFGIVMVGLL